jgi:hypothetical protein
MVMDSYVYIKAAILGMNANSFPIGYSKFLKFFSLFSRSTTILVWVQYLLLESACILFFFTLLYFFRPSRVVTIILFVFLFCNPLFPFLSNFIMSDTLFTALTIAWVTQLIWIIGRPRPFMIWTQAILLLLVFTIRYNALYYPVIAAVALLLSRLPVRQKIVAIALPFVFLAAFVFYTRYEMQQLTGVKQFSPFGGWQLANNALYVYSHIYKEKQDAFPDQFRGMDSAIRRYFDSTPRVETLLEYNADESGYYYTADNKSPLVQYMRWQYGADTVFQDFKKWGPMGFRYSQYGSYLIRKHPLAFVEYFVWPNTIRYLFPPMEVFSKPSAYYLRRDEFGQMAKQFFGLKTLTVARPLIQFRTDLLSYYPMFFLLLNVFFVLAMVGFFLFGGLKQTDKPNLYIVGTIAFLWLCNLVFSITASCVVLRYQIFIAILELAFGLVLTDFIWRNSSPKVVKKPAETSSFYHEIQ